MLTASCGLDDRGLVEPPGSHGGSGPAPGTGGKISNPTSSGGAPGSGGMPAAGGSGDPGATGGGIGSGGAPASGGTIGTASGGAPGSGGAGPGGGAGKAVGSGGQVSTGNGGRGGAAGMNAGAGGAAKGGAGGGANATGGGAGGAGGSAGPGGAGGAGGALPCGPKTCATGCCDGDRCVTQHANDKCGANGAACAKCNSCFRCGNAGACEVDPMSTWKVVCVSATLSSTKTNFLTWDDQWDQMGGGPGGPGGPGNGGPGSATSYLPDPFCQLSTGNDRVAGATMVVTDTTTPKWNETITPSPLTAAQLMSQSTPWAVSVEDDDGRATAELACRVTPQLSANDFVSTDVSFNNVQSCLTLNLHLVCAP